MNEKFADDEAVMQRAIELAARGLGFVEPNPPVGAVVVGEHLNLLGEGFHERFGGPHAEINALSQAGRHAAGATLFVTLEPCCHFGKTGPCSAAIIAAGIRRVVVGRRDPAPHVNGGGIAQLQAAGVAVEVGLLEEQVSRLTAPFLKLIQTSLPYIHAKWAMTLDGKIASRTGASRWISNRSSRELVHRLRGRMDAILVGSATAITDDPLLTARPPGPRIATRIVVDREARLPLESRLMKTADQAPVLVAASEAAAETNVRRLRDAGAEVLCLPVTAEGHAGPMGTGSVDLVSLLQELGRRRMTNVLVEGGGRLLGGLFDQHLIDEVHVFVAPKLVGGERGITPLGGIGLPEIPRLPQLDGPEIEIVEQDVYIHGPLGRKAE